MKKILLVTGCWLLVGVVFGQTVTQKLQKAFQRFESDSQLKHAISSLYVIDAATGQVVFDKNSQVGLAGASTQKIVTATTAFELLGKDYRYKTNLGYYGNIRHDTLSGTLIIAGSGDPTLGSWRYEKTKDTFVLQEWGNAIKNAGISYIKGGFTYDPRKFSAKTIPDGWIWQDLGNYYGAAPGILNWRENQVDVILRSGNIIGSEVEIISPAWSFTNELKAAPKGTGDNAYGYLPNSNNWVLAGSIPVGEPSFKISISSDPIQDIQVDLLKLFSEKNIKSKYFDYVPAKNLVFDSLKGKFNLINTHYSPSLDSIIYWFLKKSINLYGEALIKTFAYEKQGFGSTDSGVAIIKKFWKEKGLDEDELNIYDGSGLSPLNRITTHAQVEVLKYAKTRNWFTYFYDALPEYNGMKMKSGTISDVKGFCGYQKSKNGKEYIFSFLVNNYNGRTSGVVSKMYKVLDELK